MTGIRILFDDCERPKTEEELARIMGNMRAAKRIEFKSEVVDDRETDDRFSGFMIFNPIQPKLDKIYFY